MKTNDVFFFILLLPILACKTSAPESCKENEGMNRLLVFVGEKIEVCYTEPEPESIDGKFIATYKILNAME